MDNAIDALIMAASVLLLIIALSVNISSFSSMKVELDDIITRDDTIDMAQLENGEYLNYIKNADDIRSVSIDTVITSIRRGLKENYKVYIYSPTINGVYNSTDPKYNYLRKTFSTISVNQFYKEYGNVGAQSKPIIPEGGIVIRTALDDANYKNISNDGKYVLGSLYEIAVANNLKFKEYIGIYQEKLYGISSANKITYRVITFVEDKTT